MEGQLIWRGSGHGYQCLSKRVQRINMMPKSNVLVFLSIAILCLLLPRVPNTRKDCFYHYQDRISVSKTDLMSCVKLDLVMKHAKLEIKFELGHRVVQVQQSGGQLKRLLSIQHLQRPEKTQI